MVKAIAVAGYREKITSLFFNPSFNIKIISLYARYALLGKVLGFFTIFYFCLKVGQIVNINDAS